MVQSDNRAEEENIRALQTVFPTKVCALLKELFNIDTRERVSSPRIPKILSPWQNQGEREAKRQQYTHPRQHQLVSGTNIPLEWQWQSGKGTAKATQPLRGQQ